eukprot:28534-Pelagococcus_subviridis.AAC.1
MPRWEKGKPSPKLAHMSTVFGLYCNRPVALSENRMTPSQPRIGQINTKLICDFLIQNSYERQSDAPPHVRASPCAAAA